MQNNNFSFQGLERVHRFDKDENDEAKKKPEFKKYKELNLVCSDNFSFYKYHGMNKFKKNYLEIKYVKLGTFHRKRGKKKRKRLNKK